MKTFYCVHIAKSVCLVCREMEVEGRGGGAEAKVGGVCVCDARAMQPLLRVSAHPSSWAVTGLEQQQTAPPSSFLFSLILSALSLSVLSFLSIRFIALHFFFWYSLSLLLFLLLLFLFINIELHFDSRDIVY